MDGEGEGRERGRTLFMCTVALCRRGSTLRHLTIFSFVVMVCKKTRSDPNLDTVAHPSGSKTNSTAQLCFTAAERRTLPSRAVVSSVQHMGFLVVGPPRCVQGERIHNLVRRTSLSIVGR